jgi:hypothetical protein
MSSSPLTPALRNIIAARDQNRCVYCQSQQAISGTKFTIDHIIPQSLGGTNDPDNLCLACWDCNLSKQNRIAVLDQESGESVPLFHPVQQNWQDHFVWEMKTGCTSLAKRPLGKPPLQHSDSTAPGCYKPEFAG